MRERVTVVLFLSVCLSVCENNIWELTPLQPLKDAPNGRRPYFIGFKCAGFLTNAAVSEKKRVKTWLIEIALRVTPPLKVHVLSRWLLGMRELILKISCDLHYCEPLSLRASSNELTLLQPFCSFRKITVTRILELICSSCFLAILYSSPKSFW